MRRRIRGKTYFYVLHFHQLMITFPQESCSQVWSWNKHQLSEKLRLSPLVWMCPMGHQTASLCSSSKPNEYHPWRILIPQGEAVCKATETDGHLGQGSWEQLHCWARRCRIRPFSPASPTDSEEGQFCCPCTLTADICGCTSMLQITQSRRNPDFCYVCSAHCSVAEDFTNIVQRPQFLKSSPCWGGAL